MLNNQLSGCWIAAIKSISKRPSCFENHNTFPWHYHLYHRCHLIFFNFPDEGIRSKRWLFRDN